MEPKLAALNSFLTELGVPPEVTRLDERKLIQKGVFLGQELGGVSLGYGFNWYIRGPYSPSLAKSYFSLAHALRVGNDDKRQLPGELREKLRSLSGLFQVPKGIPLSQADWLELLASIVFLRRIRRLKPADIEATIKTEKKHLAEYLPSAWESLKTHAV
jgi:uncharacterized protein YwgA